MPSLEHESGGAATVSGKRPTIRDVAARAGVSKSLVSLVFSGGSVSEERRTRVMVAVEELGYRPNTSARSLAAAEGDFTGILVADLHNSIFSDIVDAARSELAANGRGVLFSSAAVPDARGQMQLDQRALEVFGDLRPRNLIMVGTGPGLEEVARIAPGIPIVLASTIASRFEVASTVRTDDELGMRLAVEHLVQAGHRRITHVGGNGGLVAAKRADAYRQTMADHGLAEYIRVARSDYTEQGGYTATRELFARGDAPTAIAAVNDLSAIGVLDAIADARPGAAIAVTGFDNSRISQLRQVSLSSVDPNNAAIGREAAHRILELEETGSVSEAETLVAPSLIVRRSSAALLRSVPQSTDN
ncbi:LacI family DNA-binding transcriptional regulator [Gulosibacter molinativorax]|uniref:LacI family transcriptional regulator n=1 Tax=Gulosibacter molinativorax TaxID=256821 RepID=A0ABT7C429_9MICO|nr:LacI family DNA-binding transcriptional regulator [Gulosibacter molinativorax]MDJ1369979.1 LacI family transcriptional regulator [Gulosibacter molinativorax]QUY63831.1 HTH-type transcriptional repressor PurR [Gulosibacter molinativorax]